MLHAGKGAAHLLDGLHGYLTPDCGGSGQQILDIVQAPQLDVLLGQEGRYHAVLGHAEHVVLFAQECTVVSCRRVNQTCLPLQSFCMERLISFS